MAVEARAGRWQSAGLYLGSHNPIQLGASVLVLTRLELFVLLGDFQDQVGNIQMIIDTTGVWWFFGIIWGGGIFWP